MTKRKKKSSVKSQVMILREDSPLYHINGNGHSNGHANDEMTIAELQILTGDCRKLLTHLPSESVQCCVTSPPYWGLRDYDHEEQIGAEASPDQYVKNLVEIFREVRRVLKRNGTFWLNVGDGYARNGGTGNHGPNAIVGNTRKLIQKHSCKTVKTSKIMAC